MKSTYELSREHVDKATMTPNVLSSYHGKRWRAERNFWISFFAFTLWWCVAALLPCTSVCC